MEDKDKSKRLLNINFFLKVVFQQPAYRKPLLYLVKIKWQKNRTLPKLVLGQFLIDTILNFGKKCLIEWSLLNIGVGTISWGSKPCWDVSIDTQEIFYYT